MSDTKRLSDVRQLLLSLYCTIFVFDNEEIMYFFKFYTKQNYQSLKEAKTTGTQEQNTEQLLPKFEPIFSPKDKSFALYSTQSILHKVLRISSVEDRWCHWYSNYWSIHCVIEVLLLIHLEECVRSTISLCVPAAVLFNFLNSLICY